MKSAKSNPISTINSSYTINTNLIMPMNSGDKSYLSPNRGDLGKFLVEPTDSSDEEIEQSQETFQTDENEKKKSVIPFKLSPDHQHRIKLDEDLLEGGEEASLFKQKLQASLSSSQSLSPTRKNPNHLTQRAYSHQMSPQEEYKKRLQEKLMERLQEEEEISKKKQDQTEEEGLKFPRAKKEEKRKKEGRRRKFKALGIKPGQRIRIRASGR